MHSLPIAKLSALTSDYICNTISKAKSHWISMHHSVSELDLECQSTVSELSWVHYSVTLHPYSVTKSKPCNITELQCNRAMLQSNGLECMTVLLSASGPGPLAKVLHPSHLGRCPFWHQHQKLCFDINIKSWDKFSKFWIHPNNHRTQVEEEL